MVRMPKLWTSDELYPPAEPADLRKLLDYVLTVQRDSGGRTLLRRALEAPERVSLREREKELLPWLVKPGHQDLKSIMLAMFVGFAQRSETEEESEVKALQYAYALSSIPAWAVKRACDRFATGQVTAEEVGEKRALARAYCPSTAHVALVARKFAEPLQRENVRIRAALAGIAPPPVQTDEEHAASAQRVEAMLADTRKHMAVKHLEEAEREARRREERAVETRKRDLEERRAEYLAAGLEPPPVKNGIVTSLSMMLHMGWTIGEHSGRRMLIAPPRAAPRPRETQIGEMGS